MVRIPVLLVLLTGGTAAAAQPTAPGNAGVFSVTPAPRFGVDLPELERGAEAFVPATGVAIRTDPFYGATRGAKTGALIGLSVGAVAVATTFVLADDGHLSCDFLCNWQAVAMIAVPFTALTALTGGIIGSERATRRPRPLR